MPRSPDHDTEQRNMLPSWNVGCTAGNTCTAGPGTRMPVSVLLSRLFLQTDTAATNGTTVNFFLHSIKLKLKKILCSLSSLLHLLSLGQVPHCCCKGGAGTQGSEHSFSPFLKGKNSASTQIQKKVRSFSNIGRKMDPSPTSVECYPTKNAPAGIHWYHLFLVFWRMSSLRINVESSYMIFLLLLRYSYDFSYLTH